MNTDTDPRVQQQIIGLDVAVDKAESVYGVDGKNGFGNVELCLLFSHRIFLH